MFRYRTALLAWTSLLFVQMSGLHLHADTDGHHHDGAQTLHIAQAFSADHVDDSTHADVSIGEPAPSAGFKVDDVVATPALPALDALTFPHFYEEAVHLRPPRSDRAYWRPLLRAPPRLS